MQRFEDAQFLLIAGQRTTASVYLAGYCVECILKTLILVSATRQQRHAVLSSFRGAKAHDFRWLRREYLRHGGSPPPREIARRFDLVNNWTTDMRYQPRTTKRREAELFLDAVESILEWADMRL